MRRTEFSALVESHLVSNKPGFKPWFETLPQVAVAELNAIRERWRNGEYRGSSKRSVARAVIKAAQSRGWRTSGIQGVIRWLEMETN